MLLQIVSFIALLTTFDGADANPFFGLLGDDFRKMHLIIKSISNWLESGFLQESILLKITSGRLLNPVAVQSGGGKPCNRIDRRGCDDDYYDDDDLCCK